MIPVCFIHKPLIFKKKVKLMNLNELFSLFCCLNLDDVIFQKMFFVVCCFISYFYFFVVQKKQINLIYSIYWTLIMLMMTISFVFRVFFCLCLNVFTLIIRFSSYYILNSFNYSILSLSLSLSHSILINKFSIISSVINIYHFPNLNSIYILLLLLLSGRIISKW